MEIPPRIFKDSLGNLLDPTEVVFPILTGDFETGQYEFVGTGFFIHTHGGFLTAKHVMYKKNGTPINPFYALQIIQGRAVIRKISHWSTHKTTDIAIGLLVPKKHENGVWVSDPITVTPLSLNMEKPKIGDVVRTFAYPLSKVVLDEGQQIASLNKNWQEGVIEEVFPNGRDKTFLPDICYQTSLTIKGGASGGPVLLNGGVIGVNSTGYDEIPVSYITPLDNLYGMSVKHGNGTITVRELIDKRLIPVIRNTPSTFDE